MTNWYKKAQLNNPEYYLDNFLLVEAEKAATGANIHSIRKYEQGYLSATIALNDKNYKTLKEKESLINMRNNSEQKLKDFIEQDRIIKNKKNKRIR